MFNNTSLKICNLATTILFSASVAGCGEKPSIGSSKSGPSAPPIHSLPGLTIRTATALECPAGGTVVASWVDLNGDGIYQAQSEGELKTNLVCNGMSGMNGVNGTNGASGQAGAHGANGAKGDDGIKGDTGAKGDKGDKGDVSTVAGPAGTPGTGISENAGYALINAALLKSSPSTFGDKCIKVGGLCYLAGLNLSEFELSGADLSLSDLTGTSLKGAIVTATVLGDVVVAATQAHSCSDVGSFGYDSSGLLICVLFFGGKNWYNVQDASSNNIPYPAPTGSYTFFGASYLYTASVSGTKLPSGFGPVSSSGTCADTACLSVQ